MGADIHMVLERQLPNGQWITTNTLSPHESLKGWSRPACSARNYRLFAKLAGVRGDGPEPKGLPADISETAKYLADADGLDGHSHSWMMVEEALPLFVECAPDLTEFARGYPADWFFGLDAKDVADSRIVFWFDN